MLVPEMGSYSPRQHSYQFWNRWKPNILHKVKHSIFELEGTKLFILIPLIYCSISCAIVNLDTYSICNGSPSCDPHKWHMEVARLGAEESHIEGGPGRGRNISLSGQIGKQPHLTLARDKCWQKSTDGLQWTAEQMCKRWVSHIMHLHWRRMGWVCFIMCLHWIRYPAAILSWTCVVCTWHVAWRQTVSVQCLWQIVPEGCGLIVVDELRVCFSPLWLDGLLLLDDSCSVS